MHAREALRRLRVPREVVAHSEKVAVIARALAAACLQNGVKVDARLVGEGALLHDVGRARTQAVSHGAVGAEMLRGLGFDEGVARVAETHVCFGLSGKEAAAAGMDARNCLPSTLEEKLVCFADKLSEPGKAARIIRASADKKCVAGRMVRLRRGVERVCGKVRKAQEFNAMAVVRRKGKFLAMKRVSPGVWEFPGGKIEWGESPAEAAERECLEEAGIRVRAGKLLGVTSAIYWKGGALKHSVYFVYEVAETGKRAEPKVNAEHSSFAWVSGKQLAKLRLGLNVEPVIGFIKGG